MRKHLVIFAKAPRMGRAKRRLAADIGAVDAIRFQRTVLAQTLRTLGRDTRWDTWLANTGGAYRWPGVPRRLSQPSGDLGRRMDRTIRRFPAGPVVIIGSDIPDITPRHIADAFRALGRHDAVFGPADDGGYWLVGLRRRPAHPDLFRRVRWSTEHALADTIANLGDRFSHACIETLVDIDDAAALARWKRS